MVPMISGQHFCPLAGHLLTPVCLSDLTFSLPHVAQILARLCMLCFLFPLPIVFTQSDTDVPIGAHEALLAPALSAAHSPLLRSSVTRRSRSSEGSEGTDRERQKNSRFYKHLSIQLTTRAVLKPMKSTLVSFLR